MQLLERLPAFYAKGRETVAIEKALSKAVLEAQAAKEDGWRQLDVMTATWGLSFWEEAYGIQSEAGKSDEYRRTRILAKMRGAGTTTAALIENVAESFSNGAVLIEEHPAEHRFVVRFVGTLGIPPNLEDLKAAIEELKPAHLVVGYWIVYRTHQQLGPYLHGDLKQYTHERLRGGDLD